MSAPLHILIANNIYPPIMAGGAELIVAYLAEGLAAKGHRVTVVSTCGPEMEPYPVEIRNDVEIIRFFPKNRYWHWERGNRRGYEKALWHLRDAWNHDAGERLDAILAEKKPDILHTHLIDGMSAILWKRAKQHGVKTLHTAHDYHLLCPRALMLTKSLKICTKPQIGCQIYRKWHVHTAKYVDLFTSPSKFLIKKHIAYGLPSTNTAVVANGIPLPIIAPKIRDKNAPRRFLFAARMTVEKGCQVLIDAIKLLPKDANCEIMIAGKGVFEEAFKHAASKDSRITLLGYIQGDSKHEAFTKADCLIIPSLWYENAPVVIVEAAAYGIGVIGSDIGAIPEFVSHEKTGLLFEAGNAQALADAMMRVINDDTLVENFTHHAKPLVDRSSVEMMVDNYVAHYKHLTSPNNS